MVLFLLLVLAQSHGTRYAERPVLGCEPTPPAERSDRATTAMPGLHNVFRITDKLFSGSSPDSAEGFRALQKLGIKTIISVDGAKPDVTAAHQCGLRYVHLPIGYEGMSRDQALRITKAVRDLPGPVYLHCHHGQHRGPAAAAVVHLWLDTTCSIATALAEMKRAGTDPHYTGLYAAPQTLRRPTPQELDQLPADFPEVAPVAALAERMVSIDHHWENLKQVRQSGWKTPADHPDLDPAHEALQLVEQFRESARLDSLKERPREFAAWLKDAERKAELLEALLRHGKERQSVDRSAADQAFQEVGMRCTRCHAKYRDVPRSP